MYVRLHTCTDAKHRCVRQNVLYSISIRTKRKQLRCLAFGYLRKRCERRNNVLAKPSDCILTMHADDVRWSAVRNPLTLPFLIFFLYQKTDNLLLLPPMSTIACSIHFIRFLCCLSELYD
jgi:hypothetical protein